jgi:pimeloyl-ACP methyl ester carboxylesterase
MGGGAQTLEDHAWGKGKHDNFVRMSIDRLTLNYPLVLTHTAFACIKPYDYGADSGNELTVGGTVSGPDGDLPDIEISYGIFYKDSTTEFRTARTDRTGIYGATHPVTKEIAYVDFYMLNEEDFPKYKSEKIVAIYEFLEQPPIGDKEVKIEENPKTGKPFTAVAADGVSTLKFTLSLPGCTDVKIHVQGRHGKFAGDCMDSKRMITLDSKGQAEIIYTPRPTISKYYLTTDMDVHSDDPPVYGGIDSMEVRYTDAYGREGKIRTKILVCRPPVMLVHGFLGGPDTWSMLSKFLQKCKYDTYMGNYYATNQNIESLAVTLRLDIRRQKMEYANANINLTKVDIIGHSMGGLIARSYTHNETIYRDDVRKLITVGTPHRGSSWIDVEFGKKGAAWFVTHKIPAEQLLANSPFLQKLNKGWDKRGHLNSKVEHGNIYGFPGDLIVSATSAYLNGVVNHPEFNVKHSTDISSKRTAITESEIINERIERWLQTTLPPQQLKGMNAIIYEYTGDVYVDTSEITSEKVEITPTNLISYATLRTEHESTATIHLSLINQVWGIITLDEDSEIKIGDFSPTLVEICLSKGSATFHSNSEDTHFRVPVKIEKVKADEWWNHHPHAVIRGLDTEFNIIAGDNIEVNCLEGKLIIDSSNAIEGDIILSASESMIIQPQAIKIIEEIKDDDSENIIVDIGYVCPQNYTEAYEQCMAAYNKMAKLMAEGKGDTPEGAEAYREYARANECLESLPLEGLNETEQPAPSGLGMLCQEATLTHSGFDFSEGTAGESLIRDGEIIFWQPGSATHPDYPRDSGYLWWRNTRLDDVNRSSQTKDMGTVDIATVREVPAEWDKSPLIPPLLVGHTIVAKCYDGYVKFQVISVGPTDESARVKYCYSPNTTFPEETLTPTPTISCNWTGAWQTSWGEMVLSQTWNQVNGTYPHDSGRITGTVSGSDLTGTWSEGPSYSPPNDAGDMQLTIAADCNSFTGIWRYGSSGGWSNIPGMKIMGQTMVLLLCPELVGRR